MIGRTHRVGRGEMENGDRKSLRLTKVYAGTGGKSFAKTKRKLENGKRFVRLRVEPELYYFCRLEDDGFAGLRRRGVLVLL
jgi:hypothetical protein